MEYGVRIIVQRNVAAQLDYLFKKCKKMKVTAFR